MSSENSKKTITVEEFLSATKGKQYEVISSEKHRTCTELNGSDIPQSYRMDTVEEIIVKADGSYVLNYGSGCPHYTFRELEK